MTIKKIYSPPECYCYWRVDVYSISVFLMNL